MGADFVMGSGPIAKPHPQSNPSQPLPLLVS